MDAYHVPGSIGSILEALYIIYLNLVLTQKPYLDGYYYPHFVGKKTEA